MPIKYRESYPLDWEDIALTVKEANNWQCQACQRQCTRPGQPYAGVANVLTVAHVDPNSYDQEFAQVASLCVRCHLVMDAPFGWVARHRHARNRQERAGQLTLSFSFPRGIA